VVAGSGFDSQAQHPRCRGAVPGRGPGSAHSQALGWGGWPGRGSQARTIAAPPPDCLVARVRIPGWLLAPRSADAVLLATRSPTIDPADPELSVSLRSPAFEDAGDSGGKPCRVRVADALPGPHQVRKARLACPAAGGGKRLSVQGDQVAPGWRRPGSRRRVIALELVAVLRSAGLDLQQGNSASLVALDEVRVAGLAVKPVGADNSVTAGDLACFT
jgi:hypothetical protein